MVFYTWGNLYFVASEVLEHFYRWNCGFEESENNSKRPVLGNKVLNYRDTHITLPMHYGYSRHGKLNTAWDLFSYMGIPDMER